MPGLPAALKETNVHRVIPDHMCTTVHHSLAAYDRIVVHGDEFYSVVAPGSGRVFRYNESTDLKPVDQGEWHWR